MLACGSPRALRARLRGSRRCGSAVATAAAQAFEVRPQLLRVSRAAKARRGRRSTRLTQGARTLQQELALARVARELRRALELHARLGGTAELREQVAAHARQQVIALE